MTDQRETATTMWQDQHSGKRGHQLMTKKLAETIPALYANENVADYDTVLARAKLFSPYSRWTWYVTEWNGKTGECFGLVEGFETELGYFDLTELAETTVQGGVPAVERDLYWKPKTLGEIKNEAKKGLPRIQEEGKGETMPDETGSEDQSQDVVNVEEFLFGGVTDETADDAPTEVGGELPAGDAHATEEADDAGDLETDGEPDGDSETDEEPDAADAADDGGELPAPAETETTDELKVVVSIREGRATIGVQRPSADPHIESFDDTDLFGLADEFPAVVARAKARWEEEPRHPAYVKPTPPPRQRNRRQQAPPQAVAVEEGEEAEHQQQPETLRLF